MASWIERRRQERLEDCLQQEGPLSMGDLVEAFHDYYSPPVPYRTVQRDVKALVAEGGIRVRPFSAMGARPLYEVVPLKERFEDWLGAFKVSQTAWRREMGLPEPEEPKRVVDLESLPRATEIPRSKPGELSWGDYVEWTRGKKTIVRVGWVRQVSFEHLDAGDPRLERAQDG